MSLRLYPHCHPVRRLLLNRPLMHVAIRQAAVDRDGVAQRAARSAALSRRAAGSRRGGPRSGQSRVPPDRRSRARSIACARGTACRARFVLYVGTIEPRKNLPRLIDAFADGPRPRHSRTTWCASDRMDGRRAIWPGASSGLASRTPCTSPATCRSRTCRRSTTSATSSCSRRCTKASACRWSRRWRRAFRC